MIKSGKKKFEVRLADFKIKEDDVLLLEEWNPETKKYTGEKLKKKVKYVLEFKMDDFGQAKEIKRKGLYIIQL